MNKKLISMLFTLMLAFFLVHPEFADASSNQESNITNSSQVERSLAVGEVDNRFQESLIGNSELVQPLSSIWYLVINNGYQGLAYGPWINGVSGPGVATLRLSKSVTVTNTYSGTLTAKHADITAAVGFSLSEAKNTTASYSVKVPAGKKYKIQYRAVYKKYKATQTAYSTGIGSTVNLGSKIIYPMKYSYLDYRYVEI